VHYLLTKPHCPLCKEALLLLNQLDLDEPIELGVVDISTDEALQKEYGWLVPVLIDADDNELRWPFDAQKAKEFIES
tara:strand:+ start:2169 stop:2399 length:231 start_codon:yes stop_codon:yes gene_type:complete